ncbi:response regulator transcription factor [Phragmitibacter flavus]|uniref:Response regulator transcription factor n=1 Tax=Phragmitibacter flavus TaxID=2576071 RepID=A0A5R8KE89_9BACT|nr:response regulator transcription factor [Phragmitibacter flavus]
MNPIKVVLVDDQALFREAMCSLLAKATDLEVIADVENGERAVEIVRGLLPDVVIMDLCMPGISGIEAARRIHSENPSVRVLMLTVLEDDAELFDALRAGASGYFLKTASYQLLVEAVRVVASGEVYLPQNMVTKVVEAFRRQRSGWRDATDEQRERVRGLSDRELDILRLVAKGHSNKEVSLALQLTEGTVKNHMTSILSKLKLPDRTSAALLARDLGIV